MTDMYELSKNPAPVYQDTVVACEEKLTEIVTMPGQNELILPKRPAINIEFQDLSYTIPQGRKGSKIILRNISGQFSSGKLTAILGPSGAGKSTLLNLLAGYKCRDASGSITINGMPRNAQKFRKISRYIMQDDVVQPFLSVHEVMLVAADLKLGSNATKEYKLIVIKQILDLLRLSGARDTTTKRLSGGERKRLSIALELVNNPPVIFLDEPTTGLDDLSSSQCISLLKQLAQGGRTVICSIHTPSARLFEMFDHVYVVAAGQCVYQGQTNNIVPFMAHLGLNCPMHYNPADFVIEASSGEYGYVLDRMVSEIENGRCPAWTPTYRKEKELLEHITVTNDEKVDVIKSNEEKEKMTKKMDFSADDIKLMYDTSSWRQFNILVRRMLLQSWRDSNYLILKASMYLLIVLVVGSLFRGFGNDGSKTLFNFGFCFTCIIVFMYIPLLPVLLYFPTEVQLVKREYFNKWYSLGAYFMAMTISQIPGQFILGSLYIFLVYFITDQPLELDRVLMFYTTCLMIGLVSESIGMIISSQLNIINGMFVGPAMTVPLIILAVYGVGDGESEIPFLIRCAMSLSYLRYGMEGIAFSVYGRDRAMLPCPESEDFCPFRHPHQLLVLMGIKDASFTYSISMLVFMFILFRVASFYLLKQRLRPNKTFTAIRYVGRIVKSHFSSF